VIGLIKQYAFRPAEEFDPSLADIAIIVGSMTAVTLAGIWIQASQGKEYKVPNLIIMHIRQRIHN
jgi:hypothetical protein